MLAVPNLAFQAPGYGLTVVPLVEASLEVKMEPAVRVSGRLLDDHELPLRGIRFGLNYYRGTESGGFGPIDFRMPLSVMRDFSNVSMGMDATESRVCRRDHK